MKVSQLVAVAVVALALSGCQAREEAPSATVVPQTPTSSSATPADPGAATRTVTATVGSTGNPAGAQAVDPAGFQTGGGVAFLSPSRNIACGLTTAMTGCQVFRTAMLPPGAECSAATMPVEQLSKGYLSQDGAAFRPSCFNQGVFYPSEEQRTLAYGRSLTAAGTTCVSEEKGVTCTRGGHGFFVSAQSFNQW